MTINTDELAVWRQQAEMYSEGGILTVPPKVMLALLDEHEAMQKRLQYERERTAQAQQVAVTLDAEYEKQLQAAEAREAALQRERDALRIILTNLRGRIVDFIHSDICGTEGERYDPDDLSGCYCPLGLTPAIDAALAAGKGDKD